MGDILTKDDKIIANPNCSTIQMLMALYPIQKNMGLLELLYLLISLLLELE